MSQKQKTAVLVFPFDLFGNAGTSTGALAMSDFVRELLADNAEETRKTRCDTYRNAVKLKELTFGNLKALQTWKQVGRQAFRQSLKNEDRILWLGGNHLSVLPVYEELGGEAASGTLVLQFDAHLDVYQLHDVTANMSNGNFLLHSDVPLPTIVNLGHRDLFLPAAEVRAKFSGAYSSLDMIREPERFAAEIGKRCEKAKRIWIDIDVDVFDPAYVPGVQHPLPCGLSPLLLLKFLDAAMDGHVIGVSFSEFDTGRDIRDQSLSTLGWLIEWLLLRWYEG